MLRMLRATAQAGLAWDVQALFPAALARLAREAQLAALAGPEDQGEEGEEAAALLEDPAALGGGAARDRELRLELLLALATSGHLELALALAREARLDESLHAVLLRHYLLRGRDDEAEEHLAPLRHEPLVADLVLEALWHRLAACLQVLCNDAGAQHALVLCALSRELLDRLVDLEVDEATARFVTEDVARALRSCRALAARPQLQEHSARFEEAVHVAVALLHATSPDPLAASM